MEIQGLNKLLDSLGEAFSVFDFSFFISGAVTLGFIALDLHYYGHDGILQLQGWKSVAVYILAIYVCGLISWSSGKNMRWLILRFLWGKGGIENDFNRIYEKNKNYYVNVNNSSMNQSDEINNYGLEYTKIWIVIGKTPTLASKFSSLNKMWVMIAVYEGLAFSWLVGLFVYFDGWLMGNWIKTSCLFFNIIPPFVLLSLIYVSLHRATAYSRDLIKEVVATFYNKD